MSTVLKVLSWLLMGVSVVMTALFYTGNMSEEPFIFWAYILFAFAGLLALVFPVYFFIRSPKNAIKTLAALAVMGLVFVVGYLLADATPIPSPTQNPDLSNASVLVFTDTGLIATYVMFGVAIFLLLFSGVKSFINK